MKKKQIIAYFSRFGGVGISFLLSSFLARVLGADTFGTYSYMLSIVMLLTLPTQSAIPVIALRDMARNKLAQKKVELPEKFSSFIVQVIFYGVLIVGLAIGIINYYEVPNVVSWQVYIFAPLCVLIPLSMLFSSICRGGGYLLTSMIPEHVIRPSIVLVCVFALYVQYSAVSIYAAIVSTVVSYLLITIYYLIFIKINFEKGTTAKAATDYSFKQLFNLSIISGGQVIFANIEVFILGALVESEQVAIFKIALVISLIIIFSQTVVNQIIQPEIVKKYESGDAEKLQDLIGNSSLLITVLGVIVFTLVLVFGESFIIYFYGAEYQAAYYILLILSFGQIANMGIGSVSTILNMTRNESYAVKPMLVTIVLNILFDVLLIFYFGVYGAAMSATLSMLLWNFLLRKQVMKRTGIESSGLVFLLNKVCKS